MAVEAGNESPYPELLPGDRKLKGPNKPRYRWPLVVAGIVVLGLLLAMIWMSYEIRRTQRIRDANAPSAKP